MSELKPCPFCGGEPSTVERPDNIDGTEFFYAVACYCGGYSACAHKMAKRKTAEQAKSDAIAAWNRRASQQEASPPGAPIQDARQLTIERIEELIAAHSDASGFFGKRMFALAIEREVRSLLSGEVQTAMQGGSVHRDSKTGEPVSCSSGHDGTGRTSVESGVS